MKKVLLLLILLVIPISANALEYPKLNSKKVEIYDLNDKKILYEINSKEITSIASLTKIATTITAIESINNLDSKVVITDAMLKTVSPEASIANLRVGDTLTYKDLLYASMLPSGADATNSIAISTSGSIENFVVKMNDLAKKLKLNNTHFVNVTGLDIEDHQSTTDDVRKLLEYALKNKTFREIYTSKQYQMSNGQIVKSTLYKYNTDSNSIDKIIGSKTGFTNQAGYCLSSLANINNHEIIILVLDSSKINNQFYNIIDTISLIDYLKDNYKYETLIEKNKQIKTIPVELSKIEKYEIYSDKKIEKYLPSDYNKNDFKIKYSGLNELSFKNKKGSKIGTVSYYYKDELLYKQNIILKEKININFIKILKKYYIIILPILVTIIFSLVLIIKRKSN